MEPWKSHLAQSLQNPFWMLQWGHGDGAVEEKTPPIQMVQ